MSDIAPTNEHRIVSKAMTERDISPLLHRGVDGSWFFNSEHREPLRFILDHYEKYGNVPTKVTFQKQIGSAYKLFAVTESYDALIDEQANTLRWTAMRQMLPDYQTLLNDGDTEGAERLLQSTAEKVARFMPTKSVLADALSNDRIDEREKEYTVRESGASSILGMRTGFKTIDAATLGLQPGHLVTLVALPKVGKTSLTLAMANNVYRRYKKPTLFVTYEMSVREIEMRQDSLMAGVNFRRLQSGDLEPAERDQYFDYLDKARRKYTWPFHLMDASVGTTISVIGAQVERLEPSAVFVDGVYLLRDEQTGETNTPQALTGISRSLKQLAARYQVPVVINTQALNWKSKGQRISVDSIGYSSAFLQDSDVVLGLERIQPGKGENPDDYEQQRILRVMASRNTGLASVELVFDYDEGDISELK